MGVRSALAVCCSSSEGVKADGCHLWDITQHGNNGVDALPLLDKDNAVPGILLPLHFCEYCHQFLELGKADVCPSLCYCQGIQG